MSDMVTGLLAAGVSVMRFDEQLQSNRAVDYDIHEGCEAQLPMAHTLIAAQG